MKDTKEKSKNEDKELNRQFHILADLIIDSFLETRKKEKVIKLKGAQVNNKGTKMAVLDNSFVELSSPERPY